MRYYLLGRNLIDLGLAIITLSVAIVFFSSAYSNFVYAIDSFPECYYEFCEGLALFFIFGGFCVLFVMLTKVMLWRIEYRKKGIKF